MPLEEERRGTNFHSKRSKCCFDIDFFFFTFSAIVTTWEIGITSTSMLNFQISWALLTRLLKRFCDVI